MVAPALLARTVVWHSIRRTFSVVCVLLVIGGLCWAVYVMAVKPHTNPTATQYQKAEKIENIIYNYPEKKSLIDWKIWVFRVKIW